MSEIDKVEICVSSFLLFQNPALCNESVYYLKISLNVEQQLFSCIAFEGGSLIFHHKFINDPQKNKVHLFYTNIAITFPIKEISNL